MTILLCLFVMNNRSIKSFIEKFKPDQVLSSFGWHSWRLKFEFRTARWSLWTRRSRRYSRPGDFKFHPLKCKTTEPKKLYRFKYDFNSKNRFDFWIVCNAKESWVPARRRSHQEWQQLKNQEEKTIHIRGYKYALNKP